MEQDALTIILGGPAMFSLLLDYTKMKGITSLRFPALRVISTSGAPLTATVKAETEKLLGQNSAQRLWRNRMLANNRASSDG